MCHINMILLISFDLDQGMYSATAEQEKEKNRMG